MREFLLKQGVPQKLLDEVEAFRNYYKLEDEYTGYPSLGINIMVARFGQS